MDVVIAAVGRLKAGAESDLFARYLDRARRGGAKLGLRSFNVHEIPESRASRPAERMAQEAETLLALTGPGDRLICLEEGGRLVDSKDFAATLSRLAEASVPRAVFAIGGADGLGQQVLSRAAQRLSLGRMTFPHQIVRVLLAEQLYRATTILSGHPYHRA